jgi:hypothetical protein
VKDYELIAQLDGAFRDAFEAALYQASLDGKSREVGRTVILTEQAEALERSANCLWVNTPFKIEQGERDGDGKSLVTIHVPRRPSVERADSEAPPT